ncbi:uncharacterized protein VTP21DRAFT_7643 [Calcarisporiella thermophila]|uniref:uncharacterized protein n=1 Tax=Calcarisporiella thermophila TaxID=911321 RepID=UPI003741FE72
MPRNIPSSTRSTRRRGAGGGATSSHEHQTNPMATPTKFREPRLQLSNSSDFTPQSGPNISGASSTLGLTPPLLINPFHNSPALAHQSTPSMLGNQSFRPPTRVDRLRMLRHDALQQHLWETAAFWGDKVVALTEGDPNDVFWLAQVYYHTGQYTRAEKLLFKKNLLDNSVACRLLAAQCMIKQEKYQEALDILGKENPFAQGKDLPEVKNVDGGVKLEASMCYYRGLVYQKQNNMDRAKRCFKEALAIDIKCYEAFDALICQQMLSSKEEHALIASLKFADQLDEDAEFVKSLYLTKLKKYNDLEDIDTAISTLGVKYSLVNHPEVLLCRADICYTQCRFEECFETLSKIIEIDPFDLPSLPLYIACLYELRKKNKLFILAHELVAKHPTLPVSWFAVGVYYYLIGKNSEARRYFSKASTMDMRYGPAWIGFGHSFAMEGEHDQAISAYSTSSRLFQGSHLPPLFIGMQHLHLSHITQAEEYLLASYRICDLDPLLLNELGVLHYNKGEYEQAITHLRKSLELMEATYAFPEMQETAYNNLGHCYRKLKQFDTALDLFSRVLVISPQNAAAHAALGMLHQLRGETDAAIASYHAALAIRSDDVVASDLLTGILEYSATDPLRLDTAMIGT